MPWAGGGLREVAPRDEGSEKGSGPGTWPELMQQEEPPHKRADLGGGPSILQPLPSREEAGGYTR